MAPGCADEDGKVSGSQHHQQPLTLPTTIRQFADIAVEAVGHPNVPVWPLADLFEAMARDNLRPMFLDVAAALEAKLSGACVTEKKTPLAAINNSRIEGQALDNDGSTDDPSVQKQAAATLKEKLVTTPIANLSKSCHRAGGLVEKSSAKSGFSSLLRGEKTKETLIKRIQFTTAWF